MSRKDVGMSGQNMNSTRTIILDCFAAIFALYFICAIVWAFQNPGQVQKPMAWQMKLALADVLPCVFTIVWFSYRYVTTWSKKFPFLLLALNNGLLAIIVTLASILASIIIRKP